jgi:hypothetical protein
MFFLTALFITGEVQLPENPRMPWLNKSGDK